MIGLRQADYTTPAKSARPALSDWLGLMKANDHVPAPQGKLTHGFDCPEQPPRTKLVATEAQRWSRDNLGNLGISVQSVGWLGVGRENTECQMSPISAVLPLKAYGRRYIDDPRRCHILLTSLPTFAPDDMFEDIFVVVPARERAHAEALRRDWQSLPLVVIDEEEILPAFRDHPLTLNAGWYRQQLVKLCAANLSKTEFFITFDSDVILTKPICVADIVLDGKALLEPEDRALHSRWWTGSGVILDVPVDLSAPGMAVTPAILSCTICRRLFQHLEDRSQQPWVVLLFRISPDNLLLKRECDNWSEYSLYYLLA